jgi:hypothetical protein
MTDRQRAEIEEKIARGLFRWHPGVCCNGEVSIIDGYCDKCGQEQLEDSSRDHVHRVQPLKFCTSFAAALRAIEKLWEMKVQVRIFSKLSQRAGFLRTITTEHFECVVEPPHSVPGFSGRSVGSSAPEAIACAIAKFIKKESSLIRLHVEHFRERGLEEFREQIKKLR